MHIVILIILNIIQWTSRNNSPCGGSNTVENTKALPERHGLNIRKCIHKKPMTEIFYFRNDTTMFGKPSSKRVMRYSAEEIWSTDQLTVMWKTIFHLFFKDGHKNKLLTVLQVPWLWQLYDQVLWGRKNLKTKLFYIFAVCE